MGNKSVNYLNNNDVDTTVNLAYAMATSQKDVTTLTLKDIIDAGSTDGGTLVGKKEQFTKALISLWAKDLYTDREATEDDDPYYVDSREWGAITQVISAQAPEVRESHAWKEFTSGSSTVGTYTVYLPIVNTKYYGKSNSWELPITISYEQYSDAFKDADGFNAFRSYVTLVVRNAIKKHRKDMNDANRNNFMAEKIYYGGTVRQQGVYEFTITHVAAANDVIVVCGHEIKWVSGEASTGQISIPASDTVTKEATALIGYLNGLSTGNETNYTWTSEAGKVIATQDADAIYATPVTAAMKGTTTQTISSVSNPTVSKSPTGIQVLKLRTLYNAEMNPGSSVASAAAFMADADCLRFMNRKINEYIGYMKEQSSLFNIDNEVKFVPDDRLVVEVLNYALQASESVMQADAFHDNYVKLGGNFKKVSAWQGLGDGNLGDKFAISFAEASKIDVLIDDGSSGTTISQSGIVAFACDRYAIMHTIRSERVAARNFDPEALDMYFYQFRDMYMNNLSLPAIVFVVD